MSLRRIVPLAIILCLSFGMNALADRGIIVFTSQSDFFSAANIVSTETFDEFPTGTVLGVESVILDNIKYSINASGRWSAGSMFLPPTAPSPPNYLSVNIAGNEFFQTLTFGEGMGTNAIGFFLVGIFSGGEDHLRWKYDITVKDSANEQFSESLFLGENTAYRGYFSPDGISSVIVQPVTYMSGLALARYDNVSRGSIFPVAAVPEPSSFTLALLGWVTFVLAGVWRHGRARSAGRSLSGTTPQALN